jgi:1-acyl-sn-glycerol-3-phosphate acyltransferase
MTKEQRINQAAIGDAEDFKNINPILTGLVGHTYPIDKQGGAVKQSLDFAADLLENGWNLIMSPEGRPTFDGKLLPFRKGIGILAVETGVSVVPIKMRGYFEMFDELYKNRFRLPDRKGFIKVKIGSPVKFDKKTSYEHATQKLYKIVKSL